MNIFLSAYCGAKISAENICAADAPQIFKNAMRGWVEDQYIRALTDERLVRVGKRTEPERCEAISTAQTERIITMFEAAKKMADDDAWLIVRDCQFGEKTMDLIARIFACTEKDLSTPAWALVKHDFPCGFVPE